MIDFTQVGFKISEYRRNLGLTQDDLASKLFVTRQALSKWENGLGIPSIETIILLAKIFQVSFEDILCLNDCDEVSVDIDNIFIGHSRNYIINKLINNKLNVRIEDIFYQLSPIERMLVLKSIKEGITFVNKQELMVKLTISEQKYLGGNLLC